MSELTAMLSSVCCTCHFYLFEQVPDSHHAADEQTHQVLGVKLIIDYFCRDMERRRSDMNVKDVRRPKSGSKGRSINHIYTEMLTALTDST